MINLTPSALLAMAMTAIAANATDLPTAPSIPAKYSYLDPKKEIPRNLLSQALAYYDGHYADVRNKSYLGVVDFSAYSGKARFYIIQMSDGTVWPIHVAHGMQSDPQHSGYAKNFSNEEGSDKSSLGVYMTAETYEGEHPGLSLRLDGLSATNSNARDREIVMHEADYVSEDDVNQGRSDGCLALASTTAAKAVDELANGAVIFAGLGSD